jgi:predicted lipoprotein with Yx(FWY)xxD motif
MRRIRKLAVPTVVAAAALLAAACGASGASGSPYGQAGPTTVDPARGQSPGAAVAAGPTVTSSAVVAVTGSRLGELIVDGSGRALYLFEGDTTNGSTCYDACAQAWPPLVTVGSPQARPNVNPLDLGTSTRRDGAVQVTYHGHPLYSFVGDTKVGDTTGEGVTAFGALWYVLGADGSKIVAA